MQPKAIWQRAALLLTTLVFLQITSWLPASAAILSEQTEFIAPGVTHTEMIADSPGLNQAIHIVTIDRNNPYIHLRAQLADGLVGRKESVVSQAMQASQPGAEVVAAINGDFFTVATGTPTGMHMQQGELILNPNERPVFAVKPDGELLIDPVIMIAQVTRLDASGEAINTVVADAVNRSRNDDSLVIYTPRYGATTRTNTKGTEVVLQGISGVLKPGRPITGVVTAKQLNVGNAAIPSDGVALSGSGYSQLFLNSLNIGDNVAIAITLPEQFSTITDAVSGRPALIRNGQIATMNYSDTFNTTRHPRTAIGFNEQQVFMVTVDGRQSGYSSGMSTFLLAELLLSLGATEAINLDGGGSTTIAVRRSGDTDISVANSPSDGQARSVGNSVLVINTAPVGSLAHLHLSPSNPTLLVGSQVHFTVAGQDEYYGPVAVATDGVQWSVDGTGDISEEGLFTARQAGSAVVTAAVASEAGEASGSIQVTVVDRISRFEVLPEAAVAAVGDSVSFTVKGYDEAGRPVVVRPEQVQWSVQGDVATVDAAGHAVSTQMGESSVFAKLGDLVVTVPFSVGKSPVMLSDFETAEPWQATSARAAAIFALATAPDPVHAGAFSGQLVYDFTTGPAGTSAAYVEAKNHIKMEDRPLKIGVWVYGDGHSHWLRGHYIDGKGAQKTLDFTTSGGFNWIGWQYVEAAIDQNAPLPLVFQRLYVVETNNANKDKGIVYFDNLTAVYAEAQGLTH